MGAAYKQVFSCGLFLLVGIVDICQSYSITPIIAMYHPSYRYEIIVFRCNGQLEIKMTKIMKEDASN